MFRKTSQNENENVTRFARRLRHQGVVCDYGVALEMRITEQIFDGCISDELREAILKKRLLTLADIIEEGKVLETIQLNQQEVVACGPSTGSVHRLKSSFKQCFRCGASEHHAYDQKCPVRKKKCDKC